MLLSVILPLAYNNGLPYVREQGLDVLIDSGAGRSYLSQAVLDEDGPLATRARSVGAKNSCEAAGLAFPGASGGILGFDALGAGSSFELTSDELRLDETASPASSVVLTAKALGTATAPYPVTTRVEIKVQAPHDGVEGGEGLSQGFPRRSRRANSTARSRARWMRSWIQARPRPL